MPKAFTDEERTRIRARLIEAGRECFSRYGLEKTTVEDLTSRAGIAKSSFYLFFGSKEALYIQLVLDEAPAMMDRIAAASLRAGGSTRDVLVRLLHAIVGEVESSSFARVLLDEPEQLERLAAVLDVEDLLRRASGLFAPLVDWIAEAQRRGEIVQGDPQELVYALALIKLLPLNRGRIPPALYGRMLQLVPQILANGLTCSAWERTEDA